MGVDTNAENIEGCLCPSCEVQENSTCVIKKTPKYNEMIEEMQKTQSEELTIEPREMVGLYCSEKVGKASCRDLNCDGLCVCPSCIVWLDNNLESTQYCLENEKVE